MSLVLCVNDDNCQLAVQLEWPILFPTRPLHLLVFLRNIQGFRLGPETKAALSSSNFVVEQGSQNPLSTASLCSTTHVATANVHGRIYLRMQAPNEYFF